MVQWVLSSDLRGTPLLPDCRKPSSVLPHTSRNTLFRHQCAHQKEYLWSWRVSLDSCSRHRPCIDRLKAQDPLFPRKDEWRLCEFKASRLNVSQPCAHCTCSSSLVRVGLFLALRPSCRFPFQCAPALSLSALAQPPSGFLFEWRSSHPVAGTAPRALCS